MTQAKRKPDQRKYHYIYKITRFDGAYYIGLHSTDDLDDGYFGSGERLWKSINYHGKNKHTKEILEMFSSRTELIAREKEIVTKQLIETDSGCLNLVPGGAYFTRRPDKAEGAARKSASIKAFYADAQRSEPARQAIRAANKGKVISTAHKAILKETCSATVSRLKESGKWAEVCKKNAEAHRGKTQSEESKRKRVASIFKTKQDRYGGKYTFSEQACKNIGQSQLGNEKHAKTWIITLGDNEITVKNIAKWYRETGIIHRKDGVTLKKQATNEIVGTRRKAV